jgi:hypothetical protein
MRIWRVSGKMHSEHIGSLGTVDAEVSTRERLAFWTKLPARLARLGNRVVPEEHGKICGALHARIPMVTPAEQRAIQEENAKGDERLWDALRDLNASSIEGSKALIAKAEALNAKHAPLWRKPSKGPRPLRICSNVSSRGETVTGRLGKRLDMDAMLKAAGITRRDLRRAVVQQPDLSRV